MGLSRRGAALFLAAATLALSGCASLVGIRPAPEGTSRYEPQLTTGVPQEAPVPEVRTDGLTPLEVATVTVYQQKIRGVVNVTALSVFRNRLEQEFPVGGTGSGFIVDPRGYVVTNYHVIKGAQSLIVTMYDGSNYRARAIGQDAELDLAVLRFDPQGRRLTALIFGDSDRLQVGQRVLALGNPYGLEGTLTSGIVSGLRRPMQTESGFIVRNLIQTDAAFNPGNSGGPLLNTEGEVVGVNVSILSPTGGNVGIGFSIPSTTAGRIVRRLIEEGTVERGWIQIGGIALDPALARAAGLAQSSGLLITHVHQGGNAAAAGLRDGRNGRYVQRGVFAVPIDGDVIVAVNGQRVTNVADFIGSLELTQPGETAILTILRGTRMVEVPVVLSRRPPA